MKIMIKKLLKPPSKEKVLWRQRRSTRSLTTWKLFPKTSLRTPLTSGKELQVISRNFRRSSTRTELRK